MKKRSKLKRAAALCLAAATALSLSVAPAAASNALGTDLIRSEVQLAAGVTVTGSSFWSATYRDLRTEHYVTYLPNGTVKPLVWSGAQTDSLNRLTTAAEALAKEGWRVVAGINGGFYNTGDGTPVGMVFFDGALRSMESWNASMLGFLPDGSAFIDESVITKQVSWTCEVEVEVPEEPETPTDPEGPEASQSPEDPQIPEDPETSEAPADPEAPDVPDAPEDPESAEGTQGGSEGGRSARRTETVIRSFRFSVEAINANRRDGGLYLFTRDFGASTQIGYDGVDVWLEPVDGDGELNIGQTMTLRTVRTIDSMQEGVSPDPTIPEGCLVLSANKNCSQELLDGLRTLSPGDEVTLEISGGDPRWSDAVCGLTGLYRLLNGGQIVSGLPTGQAPRTAVGIRGDGAVLFYTIDGRQSGYSVGASYTQVAERLLELGCTDAVALDGGGSTTLGAICPGGESFTVLNSPSGGVQRAVSTSLFLVTGAEPGESADRLYVSVADDVVLAGSKTTVSAVAVDENGYEMPLQEDVVFSSEGGEIWQDEEGGLIFTAGDRAGDRTIEARAGSVEGSAAVKVVEELSKLVVTKEGSRQAVASLELQPGDELELDAHGYWYNLDVAMDDTDVEWAVTGEFCSVDENGHLTALSEGTGALSAQAGGWTVSIEVNVKRDDPFTDIADHPYRESILTLYDLGIVNGSPQDDGTFTYDPDDILTRGEVLAYISRLIGAQTERYAEVETPFEDMDEVQPWQIPYVKAMYALGVFNGTTGDVGQLVAAADDQLDREMILTMLGRTLAEQTEYDLSEMPDADQISDWALPFIQTLAARNVINGSAALGAGEGVTRGEMAVLVSRLLELPLIRPELPEDGREEAPGQDGGDEGEVVEDVGETGEGSESPEDAPESAEENFGLR